MTKPSIAAALCLLLAASPAIAQEDMGLGLPATMPAPNLAPGQMDALKRGLDASPKTPGRAAMMGKLLKLAMAMKAKKPVATEDLMSLVQYLRESNGGNGNPAFDSALQQLEAGIMKIQGAGDNPDLQELKKEFDGY